MKSVMEAQVLGAREKKTEVESEDVDAPAVGRCLASPAAPRGSHLSTNSFGGIPRLVRQHGGGARGRGPYGGTQRQRPGPTTDHLRLYCLFSFPTMSRSTSSSFLLSRSISPIRMRMTDSTVWVPVLKSARHRVAPGPASAPNAGH